MAGEEPEQTGFGLTESASRPGPSIAVAGLICWIITIGFYLAVGPDEGALGPGAERSERIKLIIATIVGGLGVFLGTILSTIGLLLSVARRKFLPDRWSQTGIILGVLGDSMLLLVLIEIFRRLLP